MLAAGRVVTGRGAWQVQAKVEKVAAQAILSILDGHGLQVLSPHPGSLRAQNVQIMAEGWSKGKVLLSSASVELADYSRLESNQEEEERCPAAGMVWVVGGQRTRTFCGF